MAIRSKKRKATDTYDDDIFTKHDGLYVDYGKFGDLTKDMLKNANILR